MLLRKQILSFLFACLALASGAQQYNFKNYSAKNGLAGSTINNIFQDSKGYIWIATQANGVSRFNGKTFSNFSSANGLVANEATYITEDHQGVIWVATLGGLSSFDGVRFKNYGEAEGLHFKEGIYCLHVDKHNQLWIATRGGGVYCYDGKIFHHYGIADGLQTETIFSITEDKKGRLWFSLDDGLACFENGHFDPYEKDPVLDNKIFFCSFTDSKGSCWFGSFGDGLVKYDGKQFHVVTLPTDLQKDYIGCISEDKKGNIWLGIDHGALKLENGKFHLFNEKQGLSANLVLSLHADYEGNMWIGTQGGGVNVFNNESFVNFTDKDGLLSKSIGVIAGYDENHFIIGTTGAGLSFYDKQKNSFKTSSGIPEVDQSTVYSLVIAADKRIWVGAQEGVFVLQWKGDQVKLLRKIDRVGETELTTAVKIIQDSRGNIWVASFGSGVVEFSGEKTILFNKDSGLPTNNIFSVFEDQKGQIWIGTKDEGLLCYNGTSFKRFTTKDGLADKTIWSITQDNAGILYFGTGEGGLSYYDGKGFHNFSMKDGLCSNYIPAIQYDRAGNALWLGTDKGINKLTFRENFAIAGLRFYGEQEGFKGIEVNQNAIYQDADGALWFGTINGLSKYDRTHDIPNETPPKLYISGIRLAYQDVDWHHYADSVDPQSGLPVDLVLSHKNNNLSFDFQAFTIDNVKYSFMLEGQDEDWSPLSSNNEAVFTNISPGKNYTFKVKALNSNGKWSKEIVSFSFSINPPWWQTWWFYTLAVVLVVAGIYFFIHYRTAHLAKEKKILEEKVTERTHELKDANDKLSVAFQDIKDSINYAKKIQDAILPLDDEIKKALPQSFVLFQPRDVVSGDFYWFNRKEDKVYIAAVDCTGHGVPGAFMSMIGSSLLNEIVSKKGSHEASDILKKLHQGVRKSLKQDRDAYESKDGMDLALAVVDLTKNTLQYAGAKRPLFFFRNGSLEEVKADKQSIGGLEMHGDYAFTNHEFALQTGDTFYMFTDGYVDQFGGEHEKKYSTKRLKERLVGLQNHSMQEQGKMLGAEMDRWIGNIEQIDDILVIGLRF